jgi:DNA-binding HxlR family transcriptional regulator
MVFIQNKVLDSQTIENRPGCVAKALDTLGNKWTALIIKELATGCARFSTLERNVAGISPRTLSQRLDDMEETGLVTKKAFAEAPPRVEYTLTEKGRDLMPVLKSMAEWGDKYSK